MTVIFSLGRPSVYAMLAKKRLWILLIASVCISLAVLLHGGVWRISSVRVLSVRMDNSERFCIVDNAVSPDAPLLNNDVSLVTHMDATRLQNALNLANAWRGPIHVSVYLTSVTLWDLAMEVIELGRLCYNDSEKFVTWNILFPAETSCPIDNKSCPKSIIRNFPTQRTEDKESCCRRISEKIGLLGIKTVQLGPPNSSFEVIPQYPHTIAMNAALNSSKSEFFMAIDSDVLPSHGMRNRFINFAEKLNLFGPAETPPPFSKVGDGVVMAKVKSYDGRAPGSSVMWSDDVTPLCRPHRNNQFPPSDLYVVPTFQVKGKIPRTVTELLLANTEGRLQGFYAFWPPAYLPTSHEIWLNHYEGQKNEQGYSDNISATKDMDCLYEVQFSHSYEPFFIARRTVPPFDERFIGHTQVDSHHTSLLASMGYRFKVLTGGFLVHAGWKIHGSGSPIILKEIEDSETFWGKYLTELDERFHS